MPRLLSSGLREEAPSAFCCQTRGMNSLGEFVKTRSDLPVEILNVSNVPLQRTAFARDKSEPGLTDDDWAVLGRVRRSKSGNMRGEIAQGVSTALVAGLRG